MNKMQMPGFEHTDVSFEGHRYNHWVNSSGNDFKLL